jgi:SSS family solute:Na+ symporter
MNWSALTVFIILFALVTVLGFVASRWRAADLNHLDQWGLGGRRFGTLVTWFLLGGDLYTAYTFIAVPALVFGAGAIGFFAVPYTLMLYPFVFVVYPRLWSVARKHGYVTASDFVRGRYGSPLLALLVAITGILATMPYIALQLVGIQVVIAAMGFNDEGLIGDIPLIVAFVILAAYTYTSGLRAPALISVVKDLLIYITVIAAITVIPAQLGGYGHIFASIAPEKLLLAPPTGDNSGAYTAYATLALGSVLALFLYPHCVTALLASGNRGVIKRNMALLPAYSLALALLAFLGYVALVSGVHDDPAYAGYFAKYGNNFAVPALMLRYFPGWFVGVAFATVAIGALVPAAIMSIAAANLFTRNIYKEYLRPEASHADEARVAKIMSLVVKLGALAFILFVPTQYAINLQLLGGVWIIQTLPTVIIGLYTRWLHRWALAGGWLLGMGLGTWMAVSQQFKPAYPLHLGGYTVPGYTALYAVILNLAVAVALTLLLRAMKVDGGADSTSPTDYEHDPA